MRILSPRLVAPLLGSSLALLGCDPRGGGEPTPSDDDDAGGDDDDAADDDDAGGTCLQGDRVYEGELAFGPLTTRSDLEEFCADYDAVDGNLGISGLSLTSLEGLDCLCGVSGFVWLYENQSLISLAGLQGVETIGGSLRLERNFALANLADIAALVDIGGELRIEENHSLISLTGLNNLDQVGGSVVLRNNSGLADTSGLGGVGLIGGDFIIDGNEGLANFAGPASLETLGGVLHIVNNDSLNAVVGFNELAEVGANIPLGSTGYDVRFANNPVLGSVEGFPRLQTLPMGLYIDGGPSLGWGAMAGVSVMQGNLELRGFGANGSITGLAGVSSVVGDLVVENFNGTNLTLNNLVTVGGSLRLRNSQQLSDVNGLAAARSIGADLIIDNNDGLTSLLGLHGLASVGGNFQVTSNNQIQNSQAEGLRDAIGEQNIGGSVTISN